MEQINKKAEKYLRKQWKKQANRLADHDLDKIVTDHKKLLIEHKHVKRVLFVTKILFGVSLAVNIIFAVAAGLTS